MAFVPIGAPVADLPTTEILGGVRTAAGFRSDRYPFCNLRVLELFNVARKDKSFYELTIS